MAYYNNDKYWTFGPKKKKIIIIIRKGFHNWIKINRQEFGSISMLLRKTMGKTVKMTYSNIYVMILKSHKNNCTILSRLTINTQIWQPSEFFSCLLGHVGTWSQTWSSPPNPTKDWDGQVVMNFWIVVLMDEAMVGLGGNAPPPPQCFLKIYYHMYGY